MAGDLGTDPVIATHCQPRTCGEVHQQFSSGVLKLTTLSTIALTPFTTTLYDTINTNQPSTL